MKKILLIILIPFLGINLHSFAQGNLLVTPVRVVFEGNKQKEELSLINTGNDTAIYSISFLQYNMTEDGNFEAIEKSGDNQEFADPFLRVFPRQITLAPRESQSIRLQYRKANNMKSGEYRSHLYFRADKGNNSALGMETKDKDTSLLSVKITPVFGVSIPVIIRNGEIKVSSTISNLRLDKSDSLQYIKFCLNRSGNISVYGDIIIEYIPNQGKAIEIGTMRGIAIYTNINKRNISFKLNTGKAITLNNGKIKIRFTSPKDAPYLLYAEQELVL
ncbi:MAG: hypothetical protein NTZ33_14705 [Bacteroidetes bacterium]|nr:hypothetical protein [Bacteroidota bacterium]